jgi:hypothetical protein
MLKVAAAAAGLLVYTWFAAVGNVERVKKRKRARARV